MKHTEIALRRPVATLMVFLALSAIGIISTRLLPLESFPDIQFPGIFITVPYPGSTPEEIERRITRPIEETLATLSGVERIESTSDKDKAEIRVLFGWDQDASAKGVEARAKLDAIRPQLPEDVDRIVVFTGSLADQPIMNLRISSDRDLSDAYDLLDRELVRPLERIDGVSIVSLYGVEPREVRILLDADRVASHNVDLSELVTLLEKSNFAVSAGLISDGSQRYSLRPQGEFRSIEDIRNLVIDENNLRLKDIAEVTLRTPDRDYGRHLNRRYAIGLDVFKQTGANMVEVGDRVIETVHEIARSPQMQGITIFELDNSADGVRQSLGDLLKEGAIGAALAMIVLYLFMRQWSSTLIVMLSVPFSLLITLGVLYFAGLTLNVLSMMGLMLAIGMLVDNAVVVTESVFRHRQLDRSRPIAATLAGVKEVGLAVLAGTMTTIIVFLPIMFGRKGEITVFLTHVAVTIVVALVASLLIAQTIVPMLSARVVAPPKPAATALMSRITERYARALTWTIAHPWKMAGLILLGLCSFLVPAKLVTFDTFPQESGRRLYMPYHIEGVHSLERTEAVVNRIEEYLYAHKEEFEIREVYSYYDTTRAESTIILTPQSEARRSTKEIIAAIQEGLPEIIIGKPSFKFDDNGGQDGFSLQLSGDSTTHLAELSRDLARVLARVPGLRDVRSEASTGDEEVRVIVDRERARQVGLSTELIANTVATAMRGAPLRELRGQDGEIEVRLAFRDSDRQSIETLAQLPLYTPDGERITLGSVADFTVATGPRRIERVDRATAAVITANLDGVSMDEIRPKIEALMDEFDLPPGYSWKFGRGFEQADETQAIMAQNMLLGVVLIIFVMAALFESTLLPLSIIISLVFSIVGVFWFFLLTATTFSFMASIGILILIGVVANNGIVLVDRINGLRREGLSREEAVVQAGRDRLRPIAMTAIVTVLSMLPLALGTTEVGGSGGPPYFPMARAMIGGLSFATVTTLLVVPRMYLWLDSLGVWWGRVLRLARGEPEPAGGAAGISA
jgi:HAE1 family hydrophobic/amphiphilic exporter-1